VDTHDEQYLQARRRVRQLRGFYIHLTVYVVVTVGLLVLNLVVGRPLWFYWSVAGWGIGLLAHGASVKGWSFLGADWEQRKIREHLDRAKTTTRQ
jgi:hypothetical protein